MKKIKCVIMDWAGTAVDYGCFAPVAGVGASADFFIKETRVWCVFLCFHGSFGFYGLDNRLTV